VYGASIVIVVGGLAVFEMSEAVLTDTADVQYSRQLSFKTD